MYVVTGVESQNASALIRVLMVRNIRLRIDDRNMLYMSDAQQSKRAGKRAGEGRGTGFVGGT